MYFMKKVIVLSFLLSLAVGTYAQVQVALGLKAGANISKFDKSGADNLTSFHGGAFALFKLTKIGIQPELLFSQQGASLNNVDLKTSYMTIPVMLKLYLVAGLNLQVGPQFGFLTKAELDGDDVKDSFKNSDISANVGLGWDLPFGLTLDARYNIGLSDLNDGDGLVTGDFKSRVVQVSVGYKIFKLGK
jgi:hypothetical protein